MSPFLFGAAGMFATMYSTQAILPELGQAFRVRPAQAGLSISVLIVALAAGAWLWGPLSDRIGRRRSLILSSGLLVLPTIGVALVPTFGALLAARGLQGLCMPGLLTVGVPYVADAFGERIGAKAMGYYVASLVAGGLVGRVGVALLTSAIGWRAALGALALLPLAATLVMRRTLPPEPAVERTPRRRGALRALLRDRQLLAATLAGCSLFFGFVGAFSFIDFRLERPPFSFPPEITSLVFCLWLLGALGPTAGRLSGRIGWRPVAFTGLALSCVGLLLSLTSSLPLVGIGLGLFALGNFAGVTATQLGVAACGGRNRGSASAIYYSAYYLAGGLGGFVPGLAWQAWGWNGVVLMAVGGFGLGLIALSTIGALKARDLRGALALSFGVLTGR